MVVSPVRVKATAGCAAATVVFRGPKGTFVTAVVKATCALVAGDVGRLLSTPDPIDDGETLEADGRVRTAGDLAPFLPTADVVLAGVVRGPAAGASARLGIFRGQRILVDKTFALGPMTPLGVALAAAGAWPRAHPQRAALLGGLDRKALEGTMISIPADLDPRYFHVAPPDQRVGRIAPGDGVLLDGVVPGHPRFTSILPELAPHVVLHGPGLPPGGVPFSMRGDTLLVDVGRGVATITFRGFLPLTSAAPQHHVTAEIAAPGQATAHDAPAAPARQAPSGPPPSSARRAPSGSPPSSKPTPALDLGSTLGIDAGSANEALRAENVMPFHRDAPAVATPEPRPATANLLATPFARAAPALEPADDEASEGSTLVVDEAAVRPAGAATPFVPGPPVVLPPAGERPKPHPLGKTVDVDPQAMQALRAQWLPFAGAPGTPAAAPPPQPAAPRSGTAFSRRSGSICSR